MIPGVPRERWLAALALPQNAAAREALERLAGQATDSAKVGLISPELAQPLERAATGKRRGEPTKLEAQFAREILDQMVSRGEITGYECEGLTFRIAHVGAVTPDFCGWEPDGRPMLFEVKGTRISEATVLRMKLHAAARPWLRWRIYARKDGAWRVTFDSG